MEGNSTSNSFSTTFKPEGYIWNITILLCFRLLHIWIKKLEEHNSISTSMFCQKVLDMQEAEGQGGGKGV